MAQSHGLLIATFAAVSLAASLPAAAATTMTADDLCKLVTTSSELRIVYTQDPADAEVRVFDIYGVGETSANHVAVFGQQISGYSPATGGGAAKLPGWRTFRLDRLKSAEASGKTFKAQTPAAGDTRLISKWTCNNPAMAVK